MPKSWIAARIAAWPMYAKMTALIVFLGFVAIQTIPLVAGYLDLLKDGHPSGYVTETLPDGRVQKWTVLTTQTPNTNLSYLLINGENQATLTVNPEYTNFSFYRKPSGYVNFEGITCPINGGKLYHVSGSNRSGNRNRLSWNGEVRFNCPAVNGAVGIEGLSTLGNLKRSNEKHRYLSDVFRGVSS